MYTIPSLRIQAHAPGTPPNLDPAAQVSLPNFGVGLPAYYVLAVSEASSNLSRYDGVRYGARSTPAGGGLNAMYMQSRGQGLGEEVKRRILMGTYGLSAGYYDAYYKRAQQVRHQGGGAQGGWIGRWGWLGWDGSHPAHIPCQPAHSCRKPQPHTLPHTLFIHLPAQVRSLVRNEMAGALSGYDALLTPTAPTTAYKLGEKSTDPLEMYKGDLMTVNVNLAGLPAIVVPCGHAAVPEAAGAGVKLPVGLQMVGAAFREVELLELAHVFEQTLQL